MKLAMKLPLFVLSLVAVSCTPAGAVQTAGFITEIINYTCQLAADQGAAEPGWEVDVCYYVDPTTGKADVTKSFTMHNPKGVTLKMKVVKP